MTLGLFKGSQIKSTQIYLENESSKETMHSSRTELSQQIASWEEVITSTYYLDTWVLCRYLGIVDERAHWTGVLNI